MWNWASGSLCALAELPTRCVVVASTDEDNASVWNVSLPSIAPEMPSDRCLAVESHLLLTRSALTLIEEDESTSGACIFNGHFAIGASSGSVLHDHRIGQTPKPARFELHSSLVAASKGVSTVSAFWMDLHSLLASTAGLLRWSARRRSARTGAQ